jgi:riboflavin transporter FmnP
LPLAADEAVQKGQVARIFLKNGASIAGTVTKVSPESVTIGKVGNYGFEEALILATEIERIEVESSSSQESIAAGVVGTVVIAAGAIVLAVLIAQPKFGPLD